MPRASRAFSFVPPRMNAPVKRMTINVRVNELHDLGHGEGISVSMTEAERTQWLVTFTEVRLGPC